MLGGRPPEGVVPAAAGSSRYSASVPLAVEPDLCVSVFVASLERLMEVRGQVNGPGRLQSVVHPAPERASEASAFDSALSAHSLKLLQLTDDRVDDGDGS